jgi:alkyldihydroxyacetonephosphate synthase
VRAGDHGTRQRSWYGWGWLEDAVGPVERDGLADLLAMRFGPTDTRTAPPEVSEIALRPARLARIPDSLAPIIQQTPVDRAGHTYGKAFRDVARAFARRWDHPPDAVAYAESEADVVAVLDWACDARYAVIPFGGGSSVVGGVEADLTGAALADRPVVSLDLTGLRGVLEVDAASACARIAGGTFGPDADAELRRHGLTMRHYPQSYEHSTVGGWVATRAGGHFATGPTHIDDSVLSTRCVTPQGISTSRLVPASGAGPSPDRLFIGSEGILGVISEVWLRVHPRPIHRASASVRFAQLQQGAGAVQQLAQSGLQPANCRLLDATEAQSAGVTDGSVVLLLGFESHDHPVDTALARATEIAADHGGSVRGGPSLGGAAGSDAAGWRAAFLRAPYLRDAMLSLGCIAETFETACTWREFPAFDAAVRDAVESALHSICGAGSVGMRFTHVYPSGPAPYYTVIAPGRPGDPMSLVAQWDEIKAAASEAIIGAGGTITHHHAVGRVHRPWYDRQRPAVFAAALRGAKQALDPTGSLNPGVLL